MPWKGLWRRSAWWNCPPGGWLGSGMSWPPKPIWTWNTPSAVWRRPPRKRWPFWERWGWLSPQRLRQGNVSSYDRVFLLLDREDRYPGPVETLPPATWATLRFRGSHRQAGEHDVRLLGECRERGLSPVGTAMEITMIDDGMTSDPEQFVTEIQIPVGMRQEKGEEQGKKKKFEKSEK